MNRIIRIFLEVLCLLVLAGTAVFLLIHWKQIPASVPTMYDSMGQIAEYGEKRSILLLPVIAAVAFVLFSLIRNVRLRSLGKTVYIPLPAVLLACTKLAVVTALCYTAVCSALVRPLGMWFLPLVLLFAIAPIVGVIGYYMATMQRGGR